MDYDLAQAITDRNRFRDENARLRTLLRFAEDAIQAEYNLRVYGSEWGRVKVSNAAPHSEKP